MSSIFGGSKSKQQSTATSQSQSTQESGNKAYDYIKDTYDPVAQGTTTNYNAIQALLGGDNSGFNAYKNATGFDFLTNQGSRGITGNAAAGGLLRSGSTGKALVNYGNNMNQQFAGNYLDRLLGLVNAGTQAGSLISGAGQYSKGQSTSTSNSQSTGKSSSKPGLGGLIGTVLTGGVG